MDSELSLERLDLLRRHRQPVSSSGGCVRQLASRLEAAATHMNTRAHAHTPHLRAHGTQCQHTPREFDGTVVGNAHTRAHAQWFAHGHEGSENTRQRQCLGNRCIGKTRQKAVSWQ